MEYNSFYGGRRGASFVIVKSYKSIRKPDTNNWFWQKVIRQDFELSEDEEISQEIIDNWVLQNCMIECFQQGGAYKTVNYDEYVLIDTPNKNDKDNGKIYRRGYKYNDDMGGAEYIGQIVGPAGMAPQVEMKTIDEVTDLLIKDGLIATEDTETIMRGKNEFILKDGEEEKAYYRTTGGSYEPNTNLLPGKYWDEDGNEQFNDEIQWLLCSVRDQDSHETTVHLGFKIPYMVTEFTAKTVSPYYHRSDADRGEPKMDWPEEGETTDFTNEELVIRTDDPKDLHPYFQRWHISVPRGIKGETFNNFRITTVEEEVDKDIKLQDYEGKIEDSTTSPTRKRQILVYDYYNYDRVAGGDPVALYLGDYNMIDDFRIDDDGTIVINYSHDDTDIYPNYLKAVDTIQLNPETGLLQIDYNYDQQYQRDDAGNIILDSEGNPTPIPGTTTHYETSLTWVKDMDVSEDGTITWTYTDQEDKVYENFIKWVTSVKLNGTTGLFEMDFNYPTESDGTPTHYETNLRWVDNIVLADDGTVTLEYTTGNDVVLDKKIKWITKTEVNNDGTLIVTYNDSTKDTFSKAIRWISDIILADDGTFTVKYNNGLPDYVKKIVWPVDIAVNTGTIEGEGNQKLSVTYNNGTKKDIGNPLNYIMKTAISDDYHLLILYSDPAKRNEIVAAGNNATWEDRDDWYDLGYIGYGQVGAIAAKLSDEVAISIAEKMPPYSAWIVIEEDFEVNEDDNYYPEEPPQGG